MELSVDQAADVLGVSPRRVRALAAAGEISARKLGRIWIIEVQDGSPARVPGRRLSARSAWGVLGLGLENLSRSERRRAEERRARIAALPPQALQRRAEVVVLHAHDAAIDRLARDGRLVLGGSSAAGAVGADLVALGRVEAYVRGSDLAPVRRDHGLRDAAPGDAVNVLLRVPRPSWPFAPGERHAPRLVVAADLLEAGDERSVRAARDLLA
ncbi:MAG: helix-turn-helix domain-containing protein [Thermoleophilia bacterium]